MSKFILSNNTEWYQSIKTCYEKAGFLLSNKNDADRYNMSVFKKLNVNNDNYYSEDGNFIACSGTLFYKGKGGGRVIKTVTERSS